MLSMHLLLTILSAQAMDSSHGVVKVKLVHDINLLYSKKLDYIKNFKKIFINLGMISS